MKNILITLRQEIVKQRIHNILNTLRLNFHFHQLKRNKYILDENAFEIEDNMVFLYPFNDGMPTCPFTFYKDDKLIIDNRNAYSQIDNIDEILIEIVRAYDRALDKKIVIDPYYFILELADEIKEDYKGKANLIVSDKAIRNLKLNKCNFDEANKYYINHFLDHFIGWNFGLSVNRNMILKQELEELNDKVIDMGIREDAGPGFEVYGSEDFEYNGLQHYKLPKEKAKIKTKIKGSLSNSVGEQ